MIETLARALSDVASSRSDSFTDLVRLAELDPQADFRFADLSGADLRGEDLRDFDLTGAKLRHARIHGALFNDSVSEAQLSEANKTNFATVVLLGHTDARAYREPIKNLSRDFFFDADLSKKFDSFRGQRNNPTRYRSKSDASLPTLLSELHGYANDTDLLLILLTSPSPSASELALEIIDSSPKGKAFAFTADPEMDRMKELRKFVRFKTQRVDSGWGRLDDLTETCRFLEACRSARPVLDVPSRNMRGVPKEMGRYQPTIIAIRGVETLEDAISRSVTYEGWGENVTLRLYVADSAYDRNAIIQGLKRRDTGRLEVCAFRKKHKYSADAYAVLAHPEASIWGALQLVNPPRTEAR
jgi:hypothetical protein